VTNRLSLRLRLLLAVGAITLVALGLADFAVYGSLHSYLYRQVDSSLEASHRAIGLTLDHPANSPYPGGTPGARGATPPIEHGGSLAPTSPAASPAGPLGPGASSFCNDARSNAPGMFIEVLTSSHKVATATSGVERCPAAQPGGAAYSPKLPAVISGFATSAPDPAESMVSFNAASTTTGGPDFRVLASELGDGRVLVLASSLAGVGSTLSQLLLVELLVTAGALVAAIALGLWLVRVGLRPLRDVERTAEAISAGELLHRVPNVNGRTEVGHLAAAFNVMLERIQLLVADLRASESRLRRFVGDASHELRTPIAAVSAYAQLFREGAATRSEDLARVMSGIERESGRMARLVNDLLTLAKFDEHRVGEREPVELVGLVLEAVETARLVGTAWPIEFVADEPIEVLGERSALRQVADNLLANVRAHSPEGTRTTVSVRHIGLLACFEVADDGPGISEEEAKLVFERFFRVDPSRSRETGGAGLGLAIVASIVSAHGGQVVATSGPEGGAIFCVTLPAIGPELGPITDE